MDIERDLLTKENSLILRGLAIMSIMLHNFLHNPMLGFTQENEMSFSGEHAKHFFSTLDITCDPYEWLSFLGWTGVVVFVFLTGFGVSRITPPANIYKTISYTKRQYLKLFVLLLPALCVFFVGDIMEHKSFIDFLKRASYLTMMANFVYPWIKCAPGVYWYFGLTFQFYLIFAFWGKSIQGKHLVWGSVLTIILLGLLCCIPQPDLLSVYKHCFTGWFVIFAIGFWLGKRSDFHVSTRHNVVFDLMSLILMLALVVVLNKWMLTWLLVPVVALAMFLAAGLLVLRTRLLSKLFRWIGNLSACIFVCHPIVRFVINKFMLHRVDSLLVVVITYVVATFLVAMAYNYFYKKQLLYFKIK